MISHDRLVFGSQFGAQNEIVPQQLASGDRQHFPDDIIQRAF
jgi:hypothetical protein